MWDIVTSCAREHLLPFAREHLLPFARDRLLPLLNEAYDMIRGVPREVADAKDELERIEAVINDAHNMAQAEEDNNPDRIRARMNQLRETAFRIEDLIDEYMICKGKEPRDPGCAALPGETVDCIKPMILRLQIAYKLQGIGSQVPEINESGRGGSQIQPLMEQGPSSSTANQNVILNYLQRAPLYLREDEVVGFEGPRDLLIGWLVKGTRKRTVISLVGMGGRGKTTLAKKVFDNQNVIGHFDFRAWITVSHFHTVDGLLRYILQKLYNERNTNPPQDISTMHGDLLINEVRQYLQEMRYVILFDDVWDVHFWHEFEFALIDNEKGSRIFITTRNIEVVRPCRQSSVVEVHELQRLTPPKSLELFYKKAFFDLNGCCPENLMNVSSEIVEKCEGLPLAIVAIGGLLAGKDRDPLQWRSFSENLSSEMDNNPDLAAITKILGLSYHDLLYHLKRCILYFGIYPEDYEVKTQRLIRQWVAEGFVRQEIGRTLEEVAEEYLTKLIHRNLVQVSSFSSDGKTRSCRVHDMVRQMILHKIQDLSFCHFTSESEDQSVPFSGMIRRLTIATSSNNLMERVETPNIRSLHVFRNEELPGSFAESIPSKYRLLKILDFEDVPLYRVVPQNLGDLFHLRYLSFRNTMITNLPGSIGTLHNLETLDIRQTMVRRMPREINRLKKLRHLLAYDKSEGVGHGIRMNDGIGDIVSLQTLREMDADHGGAAQVTELETLTQLRKLGLTNVRQEYSRALCSSITRMQHLEKLYIAAIGEHEVLDLRFHVSAPVLRKLRLTGNLNTFPYWIQMLQNLVKLSLSHSMLTDDPLTSLKDLPNLLYLDILYRAYEGKCLHFPDGGFRNLKQLVLRRLYKLNSILIDRGALHSLEMFKLVNIPKLEEVPSGVYSLPKLVFHIVNMPDEFEQSIDRARGQHDWIIEQLPFVHIVDRCW